jgi:hypothetical protein
MNLEWLQNGALATGIAAIVTSVGVAGAGGLVSVRDQHGRATKRILKHQQRLLEASEASRARERLEAKARERELLERIDELEDSVRRHHNAILDGRHGLSMLMLQPNQSDYIVGLMSKIHDQLDTRLR